MSETTQIRLVKNPQIVLQTLFLSRSPLLSGGKRMVFLTLNNGGFFGLLLVTMIQLGQGGFWKASLGFGLVLVALAALANKVLFYEPTTKSAYLLQGLLLVTLGVIFKFSGLQLALVLGAESVALFVLGCERQNLVLRAFGFATGFAATLWCLGGMKHFDADGLWTGAGLGAFLTFNAFWSRRRSGRRNGGVCPARVVFSLLALTNWMAATYFNTSGGNLPLALAAEAVALTLSIYILRVPEITVFGQVFLAAAHLSWLIHFVDARPPWWNALAVIGVTVGLSHWWQRQKTLAVHEEFGIGCQGGYALGFVAIGFAWLHPLVSAAEWLAVAGLLAVAVTGYGVATRAWFLAIGGQIFLAGGLWELWEQLGRVKPAWWFSITPILVLALFSFSTVVWFARAGAASNAARGPLMRVALVYRWLGLALSLLWIWDYIPARHYVWVYTAASVLVFIPAIIWRSREALFGAAVYALVALGLFWTPENSAKEVDWLNLQFPVAVLVMQRALRRAAPRLPVDEQVHGMIVFAGGVSLWRFVSCRAELMTSGFLVTMTWAGFAVVVFALGIFMRERFHRWLGLVVLAAAVGRVVLVDAWKQETIYRVLTFMALGVALLVIGFVYNKYQETLRKWL